MPFHTHRQPSFSDGEAAVLIRAMNRQRGGAVAEVPLTPIQGSAVTPRQRNVRGSGQAVPAARAHLRLVGEPASAKAPRKPVPVNGARSEARRRHSQEGVGERRDRSQRQHLRYEAPRNRSGRRARTGDSADRGARQERSPRQRHRQPKTGVAGVLEAATAWFAGLTPRAHRALAVTACVLALFAFFYGPTADLYAAARDHSQLVTKVEATNAVAEDLRAEVVRLQTEEGVMDEARVRGYANPGEVAVNASELLGIEETVTVPELSKPIEVEEPPIYIRALDVLMGYEEHV